MTGYMKHIQFYMSELNSIHIHFHVVEAPNEEAYRELASYGGGWSSAAYYSLNCLEYMPQGL